MKANNKEEVEKSNTKLSEKEKKEKLQKAAQLMQKKNVPHKKSANSELYRSLFEKKVKEKLEEDEEEERFEEVMRCSERCK